MDRRADLRKIFEDIDKNILSIVDPLIDELVFVEGQLEALKKHPFIKYHPNDPSIQKATPSGKLYKEFLSQEKDIVRVLCSLLNKNGSTEGESPLRAYLRGKEGQR